MVYNPYIVVPLATWAVAQISKFAIAAFRGRIDFRYLYASGGMPSVHSAVVCSLAVTALLIDGAGSHIFGLAVIIAAIVMYDSFGVRRSSGEQAAAINMLIVSMDRNRMKLDQPHLHLREILGHQPREVSVGAIVGVVLAGIFNYDRLGALGVFLQATPGRREMFWYAGVFVAVLLTGGVIKLVLRAKYPKSKIIKQLAKRVLVATQTIGWLGLLSVVFVYERASYFAWRLWPLAIILIGIIWGALLGMWAFRTAPGVLANEANEARKLKWLTWGRKRKSKRA